MPSDQAQPEAQAESVLTGVEDYFGVDQAVEATSAEKVSPDSQGTKEAVADETKENASDKTEVKETSKAEDAKEDDKKVAPPETYEVAGTKYTTLQDAIAAVNRINGDNTRLAGESKQFKEQAVELKTQVQTLETLLKDYKDANAEWQKYYDGEGDKPDVSKAEIQELITKKVNEIKQTEKELFTKQQFEAELDDVFAEPDFETVKPFFTELVNEYDGTPKVSPKKLYERARVLSKKDVLKDTVDIEKMAEELANKKLAKLEAAKSSASAGGSSHKSEETVSPVLEDYFRAQGML